MALTIEEARRKLDVWCDPDVTFKDFDRALRAYGLAVLDADHSRKDGVSAPCNCVTEWVDGARCTAYDALQARITGEE